MYLKIILLNIFKEIQKPKYVSKTNILELKLKFFKKFKFSQYLFNIK